MWKEIEWTNLGVCVPIHLSPGGMERSWGGKKGEGAASNWSQFHPRDLRILNLKLAFYRIIKRDICQDRRFEHIVLHSWLAWFIILKYLSIWCLGLYLYYCFRLCNSYGRAWLLPSLRSGLFLISPLDVFRNIGSLCNTTVKHI